MNGRRRAVAMLTAAALAALAGRYVEAKRIADGRDAEAKAETWSAQAFCGEHVEQLAYVTDTSQWIHNMGARQGGKSWGDDGMLFDNAMARPGSKNVLLGLTGTAVRENNWESIWKPTCRRFGVDDRCNNETLMRCRLPNGSRVLFGGTKDLEVILRILGNRLDGGVFVIDESQDQKDRVLSKLLDNILPPMMTPTTRIVLSGVIPEVPAGRFYRERSSQRWSKHGWGRFANVFTPEARAQLESYLQATGISIDDAQIQRDWFAREVFDTDATAYKYNSERNGFDATMLPWVAEAELPSGRLMACAPWDGIEYFSFGIDPGSYDRMAIVGWGWGRGRREVQQVFEWVTPKGADTTQGEWAGVAALARQHFGGAQWWCYDAGSGRMAIDTLRTDYGLPLVAAAKKADRLGQVRRNNTWLRDGRLKVMRGSALEEDYQRAMWDKDKRDRGEYDWAHQWHPDPSEAGRYALQAVYDQYVEPVIAAPLTPYQQWERTEGERLRREAAKRASKITPARRGAW